MSSIKNLLVNSKYRNTGTTSNFSYQLLVAIINPKKVALENIQIFNTAYTINNNNNKLYWTDSASVTHISTLTNGNYSATSLCEHVETILNADNTGANTYTVTFSIITGKITITNSASNFSLTFYTNTLNSCAYVLGFNDENKTSALTYTGDNVVNLNTKYYTVHTDLLNTNNTHQSDQINSIIAIVPNNVNFGDCICYSPNLAKSFELNQTEISSIQFYIKDDRKNIIDLNGVDWSMNLVVNC